MKTEIPSGYFASKISITSFVYLNLAQTRIAVIEKINSPAIN